MLFKKKQFERQVTLPQTVLDSILSYCQMKHPHECILILKGKSKQGNILIDGLAIPPHNYSGSTFAGFPQSFLPFDMSYVGMIHSHPSGPAEPSLDDLQNFFGLVTLIVKSPYGDDDVSAWDSNGNSIKLSII